MTPPLITSAQLRRLQAIYGQLCAHTQMENTRATRLQWAAELIGHPVLSFSDLTRAEANRLLDALAQTPAARPGKRRRNREAARRHGKDGRRDGQEFAAAPQMVSAEDLASIQNYYERLGMDRNRFDAWLRSSYSPLKKADPQIRTKAEANKVRWALKGMLQRAGLWEERKPA